jgi:hypothetical protein
VIVLDSGGVSFFAGRSGRAVALQRLLEARGEWPPFVPTAVLVEALSGARRDAPANQFLKTCEILPVLAERTARQAAFLRARARRGSAVDAIVVALADPGGTVLTSDPDDLEALAAHASLVAIERV